MSDKISNAGNMRIVGIVLALILTVFLLLGVKTAFVNVDASDIVVIQAPISGNLTVVTDPGWKWRGWGTVTEYPRRAQFGFSARKDQGNLLDESIKTQFNDGGHGNISGTMNWAMPLKPDQVIALHKDFHGFEAIEQQLIRPSMQKVIYNVGPTMSSTESSAEKRPQISAYIDDQLVNGPYLTKTVQQNVKDPITGQDKLTNVLVIATSDNGKPLREALSQITRYGVVLQPVSIEGIIYDSIVTDQIKKRQEATTQVQISIANARKAEQATITTEQEGKAAAAKAKWEQEALNAREVALAQKDLQVAQLSAQTAEQQKHKLILEGEGEAQKRQLILNADGALTQKLEAYVAVNQAYATAIQAAQPGAWTPSVIMGQSAGSGGSAQALVELLTSKTARELGLNMRIPEGAVTSRK